MTGPTLTTSRLLLKPHETSDLDEMMAVLGDPTVMGQIGVPALNREECWHRLLRYKGHWDAIGYGHWTVRDRGTGVFLGEIGLMDSRRDSEPGFEGVPEAAWALATAAHGHGYAREACEAMLGWADGQGIARTVCIISHGNAPSIRLAERLGYKAAGEVTYRDAPVLLFERAAGAQSQGIRADR